MNNISIKYSLVIYKGSLIVKWYRFSKMSPFMFRLLYLYRQDGVKEFYVFHDVEIIYINRTFCKLLAYSKSISQIKPKQKCNLEFDLFVVSVVEIIISGWHSESRLINLTQKQE